MPGHATSVGALALLATFALLLAACGDGDEGGPPPRMSAVVEGLGGEGVLLYRVESYTAGGYDSTLPGDSTPTRLPERLLHETWLRVEGGAVTETVSRLSALGGPVVTISADPVPESNFTLEAFAFEELMAETRAAIVAGDATLREADVEGLDTVVYQRDACRRSDERPDGDYIERVLVFSADFYPTGSNDCGVVTPDGETRILESSVVTLEALPIDAWPSIAAIAVEWSLGQ